MTGKECFRCKRIEKVMMNLKIDDSLICLCPTCYFDFTLYLSGCVVNPIVMVGDRKEAKEGGEGMKSYECRGCRYLYLLNDYYMCSKYQQNIGFVKICAYSDRVME